MEEIKKCKYTGLKSYKKGEGGRPIGCKNKFTTLKAAFVNAFKNVGGEQALSDWADNNKNKKDFFNMIAKMLPTKSEVESNVNIKEIKVNFIKSEKKSETE